VVDPYSAGSLLGAEFGRRGFGPIAVRSSEDVPAVFRSSYDPSVFEEVVVHRGDLDETLARLRERGVDCIVPGCELGVELADRLRERLSLHPNDPELREARRDKFRMVEAVRAHGLRAPLQHCSEDLGHLLDWVRAHRGWPVVAKPRASSSSDGVHLCHCEDDLRQAFRGIQAQQNVLGSINRGVLVQEYLEGTEYVVDTVSRDGRHRVAAFWRYGRPESSRGFLPYDSIHLLPGRGELQRGLFEFACGVLDALGVRYGPAHIELIRVDDGTPCFVEMGARLTAGKNTLLNRVCSGLCQLDLTVDAYAHPERFARGARGSYDLGKRAVVVFLMPPRPGRLRDLSRRPELEALPTLHDLSLRLQPGDRVDGIVGMAILVHEDEAAVLRDLDRIRELERNGLFVLEDEEDRGVARGGG
jgi:biotin carboxylase